jgi:hypothetical protein
MNEAEPGERSLDYLEVLQCFRVDGDAQTRNVVADVDIAFVYGRLTPKDIPKY